MRRSEDFVLVLTEGFDPRPNIRRVLFRVVGNAALGREEDAREFRAKLFFGIVGIPESVRRIQRRPIQSRRMAGPVGKLVKRGPVISGGIFECIFGRQMDAVAGAVVEGLVGLVVSDLGAGIVQNLLRQNSRLQMELAALADIPGLRRSVWH